MRKVNDTSMKTGSVPFSRKQLKTENRTKTGTQDLEEGGDPHRHSRSSPNRNSKPTPRAMKRGESTLLPQEISSGADRRKKSGKKKKTPGCEESDDQRSGDADHA